MYPESHFQMGVLIKFSDEMVLCRYCEIRTTDQSETRFHYNNTMYIILCDVHTLSRLSSNLNHQVHAQTTLWLFVIEILICLTRERLFIHGAWIGFMFHSVCPRTLFDKQFACRCTVCLYYSDHRKVYLYQVYGNKASRLRPLLR